MNLRRRFINDLPGIKPFETMFKMNNILGIMIWTKKWEDQINLDNSQRKSDSNCFCSRPSNSTVEKITEIDISHYY